MKNWLLLLLPAFCSQSPAIEQKDCAAALVRVQRVYVDQLGGPNASDQMRDILIAALQNSKLFTVTENPERADAVMKGSSDDVTFTDEHHSSETIGAHIQNGASQTGKSRIFNGAGLTDNESSSSRERKHEARASVRLVGANGDVIWSTTQESSGAKFRGAMADIADKIVVKLAQEIEKARKTVASSPQPSQP